MKNINIILAFFIPALLTSCAGGVSDGAFVLDNDGTSKQERKNVVWGNRAFADNNFAKALELYNKAMASDTLHGNDLTLYDLADGMYGMVNLSHVKDSVGGAANHDVDLSANAPAASDMGNGLNSGKDSILSNADSIYRMVAGRTENLLLKEFSFYNAGNVAYDKANYQQSIEYYKNALRLNPDNDKARENLRLAQLKQQQQQDNQDQNQDDQDQDQNQDQNQQQQQQQQQPEMSQQNAEQILKAMENAERQTRERNKQTPVNPKYIEKPW